MKIDDLFFEIFQASRDIGYVPTITYSVDDFIIDIRKSQELNIDWEDVFATLQAKLEDLKESSIILLAKKISEASQRQKSKEGHETSLEFDLEDFLTEFSELEIIESNKANSNINSSTDYNWAEGLYNGKHKDRITWISKTLKSIEEYREFFKTEKNNPPFIYPFRKDGKIPFLGSLNDFAYFFALLEVRGFFFLTHRFGDSIWQSLTDKNQENYKSIDFGKLKIRKEDLITFLVKNFYLVRVDKEGKVIHEDISYSTLKQKVGLERKKDISKDQMVVFKNFFKNILDDIDPLYKRPES